MSRERVKIEESTACLREKDVVDILHSCIDAILAESGGNTRDKLVRATKLRLLNELTDEVFKLPLVQNLEPGRVVHLTARADG